MKDLGIQAGKSMVVCCVIVGAIVSLATSARADGISDDWQSNHAPYTWVQWGTGFYTTQGGSLPTDLTDTLRIHYQRYVYLNTSEVIGQLQMFAVGGSTLSITNGGNLTVSSTGGQSGQTILSQAGGPTGPGGEPNTGIIDIYTGGSLTSSNTGARTVITGSSAQLGELNLNGGTFIANGNAVANGLEILHSEINLNSGTFDMTNGMLVPTGVDFNINGDGTTIDLGILNVSGIFNADFNFTMDSDGISTVSATDWISLTNATIVVDGTNYTGGSGTFTLFSPGGALTPPSTAPQATNFDDYEVTFGTSGSDYVMNVMPTDLLTDPVVTVPNYSFESPETATIAFTTEDWAGGTGIFHPNTTAFSVANPLAAPAHSNQTGWTELATANPASVAFTSSNSLGFVSAVYTYTLTVALGHSSSTAPGGRAPDDYTIELLVDGATAASATMSNSYGVIPFGGWQDLSTSFRATDVEHGKPLTIRLTAASDDATFRQGHFDNVRLTSTFTPWGTVIAVQ